MTVSDHAIFPFDLSRYRALAREKQKEQEKFLSALRKKPPKNLDRLTKKVHEEVFEVIDCTQCANCCTSLGPLWTEADITRMAKNLRLSVSDFEAKYLRMDEDGDKVFQSMPCPFLGFDKLCAIYDGRPKACLEFPHTDRKKIYQINPLTLKNTLICPASYLWVEQLREELNGK